MSDPSSRDQRKATPPPADVTDLYLRQLDLKAKEPDGPERRRFPRLPHRIDEGLEIVLFAAPGEHLTGRVRPRNISLGGISFLYNAFVFPGTRCTVMLPSLEAQMIEVSGQVANCRHINGKTHEIGIAFDAVLLEEDFQAIRACAQSEPVASE